MRGAASGPALPLRAEQPHQHEVLVAAADVGVLAQPALEHEPGLLVGADRPAVRLDGLEVDAAEVAAHEPELEELLDGGRADAAAAGLRQQRDADLGVTREPLGAEQADAADGRAVGLDHEPHLVAGLVRVRAGEPRVPRLARERRRGRRAPLLPRVEVGGDPVQHVLVRGDPRPQDDGRCAAHAEAAMLTSQCTPNRSVREPKASPQGLVASGVSIVAPSLSAAQYRSSSSRSSPPGATEIVPPGVSGTRGGASAPIRTYPLADTSRACMTRSVSLGSCAAWKSPKVLTWSSPPNTSR